MNSIYDNGAIMLGNVKMVKEEIKKQMKDNIDMCFADMEEILKDLEEYDENGIVAINYDNGFMGYSIDYWDAKNDFIKNNDLGMYDLVFRDIVKCYLEDINCVDEEEITLSESEINEIAHKLIYKNEYIWEIIHETIDCYIGKIINERGEK